MKDDDLKRSAEIRAAIMAAIGDGRLTRAHIAEAINPVLQRLNYSATALDNLLYNMTKSELLGHDKPTGMKTHYWKKTNGKSLEVTERKSTTKKKVADTKAASVTIDVVKSTGRVRVMFKGLAIEIGVID